MFKTRANSICLRVISTNLYLQRCTQTYQVPERDVIIEKGVKVILPVFALHQNPKYFSDPERYYLERFSSENKHKIIQGTYLPFGDGPRICIGLRLAMMEMKYTFCKILSKYEFTLVENMKYPVEFRKSLHCWPRRVGFDSTFDTLMEPTSLLNPN